MRIGPLDPVAVDPSRGKAARSRSLDNSRTGPLRVEAMMRFCAIIMILCLSVAVAQASPLLDAESARGAAARLAADVGEYTRAHPGTPGAFAPWADDVSPGDPVLVHRAADLEPSYYIVPMLDAGSRANSVATVDATTGEWQSYRALRAEEPFPAVGRERAVGVLGERLGGAVSPRDLIAVSMPNRMIYWLDRSGRAELCVSLWDATDVRGRSDPEFAVTRNAGGATPPPRASSPVPAPTWYPSSYDITSCPHYYQGTSYHCGPAALEMVFDYWGEHVNQTDIGYVANTVSPGGSYADDIRRAAHFSQNSTAIQDPTLTGYDERWPGYSASENWWSYPNTSDPDYVDRYNDLKNLVSSDYPVIILTWYDTSHNSGHFRVVKGYNNLTNVFIVHDPWYSGIYQGPNVHFNQTTLVDDLWERYYRWGLFTAPWFVSYMTVPSSPARGTQFTLIADVTYPGPHPFDGDYLAGSPYAYVVPSGGFDLAAGEMNQKLLPTITTTGTIGTASWQIVAPCHANPVAFNGHVMGVVEGASTSYPAYVDQIGRDGGPTVQASSSPNQIVVDVGGGGDYLTISEGIDAAPCDGDEVVVKPGTYTGISNKNLDFGGKNLVVYGENGPGETFIDCQNSGRGFYLHSGEDTTSFISGFTIAEGNPSGTYTYGGGILCDGASPKLTDLVIVESEANYGGAIAWIDASPVLMDIHAIHNTAYDYGGGFWCVRDTLGGRLERPHISDNSAGWSGGGFYDTYADHLIVDAFVHGNSAQFGGGFYIGRAAPDIRRALFQWNSATRGGAIFSQYESAGSVSRSTIVHNTSDVARAAFESLDTQLDVIQTIIAYNFDGSAMQCSGPKYPEVFHSLSYANAAGDSLCGNRHDNIFWDPQFCDEPMEDFTLHDNSPCLPTYNPWSVQIGAYGAGGCGYVSGVEGEPAASIFRLHPPSPNPFTGSAAIAYESPAGEGELAVAVYALNGRVVRTLYAGPVTPGPGRLIWDGSDDAGHTVASGVYFVKAVLGSEETCRKMVVLR